MICNGSSKMPSKRMPRKIKKYIKKLWERYLGYKVKCKSKKIFIALK